MNIKKYISVTIIALLGLWWFYHSAFQQGYSSAMAKVEKQAQDQKDKSIKQERQAQQNLQTKLEKIEHEKQQTVMANKSMRSELNRLQQYVNTRKLSATTSVSNQSKSNESTKGWELFSSCTKEYAGMAEVADNQRDLLAQCQAYGEIVKKLR